MIIVLNNRFGIATETSTSRLWIQPPVKHHPKPQRGVLTAEGCRPVTGMLPVGVWSMGELRISSRNDK